MNHSSQLRELLEATLSQRASDLHISAGHPPILRIAGRLVPLLRRKEVSLQESESLAFELMGEEQKERFLREKEIDFSYNFEGKGRFRVCFFSARQNYLSPSFNTQQDSNY